MPIFTIPRPKLEGSSTREVSSTDNQPLEEHKYFPIQKAIKAGDLDAFESSLQNVFKRDWKYLKGPVLHKIIIQGNTVLHEAAMVNGSLHILEIICQHAPFLMGKPNLNGETVWHIVAKENHSGDLFETLYCKRQFWMTKLEAADTLKVFVGGVLGGMDELSISAVNKYRNTALHEALLSKNKLVARKLFYADKDLGYMVNWENKSPMLLALEIGDVQLFESMFRHATSTTHGMSAIKAQIQMLTKIALTLRNGSAVVELIGNTISGDRNDKPAPKRSPKPAPKPTQTPTPKPAPKPAPGPAPKPTPKPAPKPENKQVAPRFKMIQTLMLSKARDRVTDMKMLVQSDYHLIGDPKIMIHQLQLLSILIFFSSFPFTCTSKPKFRLFFAINKLLWFLVCCGTFVLTFAQHTDNMIGLSKGVLALYLKLVKKMVMLELAVGICVLAYKLHLVTIGIKVAEWSYTFLL